MAAQPAAAMIPPEAVATTGPLLDAVDDPLIVLRNAEVALANRAAMRLLGNDLIGARLDSLIEDPAARDILRAEGPASVSIPDLGGERRHWEIRVSTLGDDRRLLHLIDRTAIEAAERMRIDFVANASHELRTPIAAITGFAETLADDEAGADSTTRHRFLDIIGREARRMQRLIEDLMSLSRIEADRHVMPADVIDLAKVAHEAAIHAAEQRMPRGADLVLVPFEGRLPVRGDAAQLAQLAHNLVSNGFKYGTAGTPVTLTLTRSEGRAQLTVADRGEGIAAHHLPRITQRFYRADASRSRAVGGTGLGLAIVKHIVDRHGGTLTIDSEVGYGTCVTVDLPLATSSPAHTPHPHGALA